MRASTEDATRFKYDVALGEVVNIIVSYDMGWSKRGDEDSSTIAAIRRERSDHVIKLADSNHLTKNFAGELYRLRSQFSAFGRKNVTKYIQTCFAHCCV